MHDPNLGAKIARARQIHAELGELEPLFRRNEPSPFAWVQPYIGLMKPDGEPWSARIIPGTYICYARISDKNIGRSYLAREGWTAVEVYIRGQCRLAYNVRGDELVLHRYEPGLWETWFGVDNAGDTLAYIPDLFADDKDPRWRAFKASGLSEWPPYFKEDRRGGSGAASVAV